MGVYRPGIYNSALMETMTPGQRAMELQYDAATNLLHIGYTPQTNRTLYDVCDVHGAVICTGPIEGASTRVALGGLSADCCIVLVLDGDRVWTDKVYLKR